VPTSEEEPFEAKQSSRWSCMSVVRNDPGLASIVLGACALLRPVRHDENHEGVI